MPVQVVQIDTITSFTEAIENSLNKTLANQELSTFKGNWYRGIGNANEHKLVPTLLRHPRLKDAKALFQLERLMLEQFERQNVLHVDVPGGIGVSAGDEGDFRSLFYMQHYGVPTRLLDWTSNPFIALYFALSSAKQDKNGDYTDDAAVWILDPVAWNKKALEDLNHKDRGPLKLDDIAMPGYRPRKLVQGEIPPSEMKQLYDVPVAMLGIANNARVFAQKGVFTIFGKDTDPMEEQFDKRAFPDDSLSKIVVARRHIQDMINRLVALGYTDSVTYPDLHGLAMEIKRLNGFVV